MNIDEKIKQELENETLDIDEIMKNEGGLFDRIAVTYRGGMRGWVIVINIAMLVIGLLIAWTGYRFYLLIDLETPLFWGVCFIVLLVMQGFAKNWIFMEMNRNSVMREIKRVEISVAQLMTKIEQ